MSPTNAGRLTIQCLSCERTCNDSDLRATENGERRSTEIATATTSNSSCPAPTLQDERQVTIFWNTRLVWNGPGGRRQWGGVLQQHVFHMFVYDCNDFRVRGCNAVRCILRDSGFLAGNETLAQTRICVAYFWISKERWWSVTPVKNICPKHALTALRRKRISPITYSMCRPIRALPCTCGGPLISCGHASTCVGAGNRHSSICLFLHRFFVPPALLPQLPSAPWCDEGRGGGAAGTGKAVGRRTLPAHFQHPSKIQTYIRTFFAHLGPNCVRTL
jgi:hypothetical protein